jgi:hypothetical protein
VLRCNVELGTAGPVSILAPIMVRILHLQRQRFGVWHFDTVPYPIFSRIPYGSLEFLPFFFFF